MSEPINLKEELNIYLEKEKQGKQKPITIISTYKLTDEDLNLIRKNFSLPSDFKILNIVDPKILGGLIIRFGSKVIDLSINGQLKKIKELIF